ncbi:MAG: hypothetical protein AAGA30_00125 [Planctomycetota bacterium]
MRLPNNFHRLIAPGLPSWPKLYVDRQSRRAFVFAKHPTWRSYRYASRFAKLLAFLVWLLATYCMWVFLHEFETESRLLISIFSSVLLFPIAQFLVIHGTVGFMARQIFATRTRVWITPNSFAYRSRMVRKPIVIWRQWKGQDVRLSFILNRDDGAAFAAAESKPGNQSPHVQQAMILEIVISSTNRQDRMASSEHLLRRTIPLTEVSSRNARKLSTVFAAAVAVTAKKANSGSQRGVDIDG